MYFETTTITIYCYKLNETKNIYRKKIMKNIDVDQIMESKNIIPLIALYALFLIFYCCFIALKKIFLNEYNLKYIQKDFIANSINLQIYLE